MNMAHGLDFGGFGGFLMQHEIPVTIYGVTTALMRSPEQLSAMVESGWEIASHGLKWVEHKDMPIEEERAAMAESIRLHTAMLGERPLGWYTGRCSMNTTQLIMEEGGFLYSSDDYSDDLPYWLPRPQGGQHLIIPYTLDANDMRFATPQGFNAGEQFFNYLKDSFDSLYEEGRKGAPKMMSIGLHCRLIGRPGRVQCLERFIDYIQRKRRVWTPRRIDIAKHWHNLSGSDINALQPKKRSWINRQSAIFKHWHKNFGG